MRKFSALAPQALAHVFNHAFISAQCFDDSALHVVGHNIDYNGRPCVVYRCELSDIFNSAQLSALSIDELAQACKEMGEASHLDMWLDVDTDSPTLTARPASFNINVARRRQIAINGLFVAFREWESVTVCPVARNLNRYFIYKALREVCPPWVTPSQGLALLEAVPQAFAPYYRENMARELFRLGELEAGRGCWRDMVDKTAAQELERLAGCSTVGLVDLSLDVDGLRLGDAYHITVTPGLNEVSAWSASNKKTVSLSLRGDALSLTPGKLEQYFKSSLTAPQAWTPGKLTASKARAWVDYIDALAAERSEYLADMQGARAQAVARLEGLGFVAEGHSFTRKVGAISCRCTVDDRGTVYHDFSVDHSEARQLFGLD